MMILFLCFIILSKLNGVRMLSCYHCISQLPLDGIEDDARLALKKLIFERYNVPPSHEFCDDASTYDFYTAETQFCEDTDQCIKISVPQKGFSFVMRGCQSHMLRSSYYLSQDTQCSNRGPSHCLCNTNLCNFSGTTNTILIIIMLCITYITLGLFM